MIAIKSLIGYEGASANTVVKYCTLQDSSPFLPCVREQTVASSGYRRRFCLMCAADSCGKYDLHPFFGLLQKTVIKSL